MSDPFAQPPQVPAGGFTPSSFGGSVVPCSNGKRLGAWLLDLVLAVLTCGIGWLIWSVVLWGQATSPGKQILKMRVVDISTGAPATTGQMVLRELIGKMALGFIPFYTIISGVLILVNASRQGAWDYIAKTTVVHEG